MQSPAVIVHSLDMARAAVALGRPLTLLSADGAACYAGVAWWQALVRQARAAAPGLRVPDILDCGDAPGYALQALRLGQRTLILRADPRIWQDIAARAEDCGAVLLAEPPLALDLAQPGAQRRLPAWLA